MAFAAEDIDRALQDIGRRSGGGNYQTLINDALPEYIHRHPTLDGVQQRNENESE